MLELQVKRGMMGHSPGQNQGFGFGGSSSGSKEMFSVSHAAGPWGAGGVGLPVDGARKAGRAYR